MIVITGLALIESAVPLLVFFGKYTYQINLFLGACF
jgi:hypothetical protein